MKLEISKYIWKATSWILFIPINTFHYINFKTITIVTHGNRNKQVSRIGYLISLGLCYSKLYSEDIFTCLIWLTLLWLVPSHTYVMEFPYENTNIPLFSFKTSSFLINHLCCDISCCNQIWVEFISCCSIVFLLVSVRPWFIVLCCLFVYDTLFCVKWLI